MAESQDKFLVRPLSDPAPTVDGYDGELDGEVYAIRSGDKTFGIAGADGQAESQRKENEAQRVVNEQGRVEAEAARESAEAQRQSTFETNEAAREAAQDANNDAQAENDAAQQKNNSDQAANNAAAQGLVAVILSSGEYDPETLEPTVSGEVGKMYLVPMPQAQAVAAALPVAFTLEETGDGTYAATRAASAEDGDVYVEWLWINSAWERIGLSTATIDPITTDQIDTVCSDGAPQGKQVLNLTGLSYLWAKVKAWATGAFAALSHTHPASQVTGLTASRALVSDSSGHPAASAVTATELGYLDGVTSGVQGQIDALGNSLSKALVLRGQAAGDAFDLQTGAYYVDMVSSPMTNMPSGCYEWGILVVLSWSSFFLLVYVENSANMTIWVTNMWSGKDPLPWRAL